MITLLSLNSIIDDLIPLPSLPNTNIVFCLYSKLFNNIDSLLKLVETIRYPSSFKFLSKEISPTLIFTLNKAP